MDQLSSDDLNERLDGQMLKIERTGILLEDAKAVTGEMLALDDECMAKLLELLDAYETFLEHFKETTEDTVATIRELLEVKEIHRCETDEDTDIDIDTEDDAP